MSKVKIIVDIDGEIVTYYEGVLKASAETQKIIQHHSYLKTLVHTDYMDNPVEANLDGTLVNITAAIISVYPERARIIEAPRWVIEELLPLEPETGK